MVQTRLKVPAIWVQTQQAGMGMAPLTITNSCMNPESGTTICFAPGLALEATLG